MSIRSLRRAAGHASLVTLAVTGLWLGSVTRADAGAPVSLDEGSSSKPAAADTSHKATKPTTTTAVAKAVPAKTATAKPARTKSTPTSAAKVAAQPSAGSKATASTTSPKSGAVAKSATPSVAKAPSPSVTKAAMPTVAKAGTPTGTKNAPTVAKARTVVPMGIPRVAPQTTRGSAAPGAVAKIPAGPATRPSAPSNVASIARVAPPPNVAGPARVSPAGHSSSITKLTPAGAPVGPTLARNGGTTVNAPNAASKTSTAGVTRITKTAVKGAMVGSGVATGPASGPQAGAKGAAPVTAPLEDHVTYQYNALGRRDPFQSLMEGEYVGADVGGNAPPDLGGLKLVGVVWGTTDQFAMVEDVRGDSYVLRRGDRVMNGYVEGLKRDAMIVNITVDGQAQSVTIPITRKGEKSNANR